MNGVERKRRKTVQTPQYKKNYNTTTKIHSTKPTNKTNQPLLRVEKKIEV